MPCVTGKTHAAVGITSAAALSLILNIRLSYVFLIGAVIGSLTPDIDLDNSTISKYLNKIIIVLFVILLIILCAHLKFDAYNLQNHFISSGLFVISLASLISRFTGHRMFSHSLLGFGTFSYGVYIMCRPIFTGFVIGYVSHILIDLLNYQGEALIFPFRGSYSFKLCKAGGIVDKSILVISMIMFINLMERMKWTLQ